MTIRFINILSGRDSQKDVSMKDFAELITDYFDGNKLENDTPFGHDFKKTIYEENGKLIGEVSFQFDSLSAVGLYKYDEVSPFMLNVGSFVNGEEFESSNGRHGGEKMPVVFWDKSTRNFSWNTTIQRDSAETVNLIDRFRDWKKSQKN
jgi:hypothetical protein